VFGNVNAKTKTAVTARGVDNVLRTTIKETLVHDSPHLGNFKGHRKATIYDPAEAARTTIKEMTLEDGADLLTNLVPPSKRGPSVSELDTARLTVRQTLDDVDTALNVRPLGTETTAAPSDDVRRTGKEMLVGLDAGPGMPETLERRNAAYMESTLYAPPTLKDRPKEYFGGAGRDRDGGTGYQVANFEAPPTVKQNHSSYYGGSAPDHTRPSDQTSVVDNARLRTPVLVVDHAPTQNGVKVSSGADAVNAAVHRITVPERHYVAVGSTVAATTDLSFPDSTRDRQDYDTLDARLDPDIMEPYRQNPYTLPSDAIAAALQ
jgi:hypothetical protein